MAFSFAVQKGLPYITRGRFPALTSQDLKPGKAERSGFKAELAVLPASEMTA